MSNTSSATVPELVRDTGLITTFRNNNTITVHRKRWNQKKREYWRRTRQLIGTGGYSRVWLETEIDHRGKLKDSPLRAVKEISCLSTQRDVFKDYIRELEAIAKFSQEKYSEYFVRSLGWYQSPSSLCIAMEYCQHGDLKRYLQQNGALAEAETQVIISQVLRGLVFMHEEGFAHRDLKPANILIINQPPSEWTVKLSDFGLSKRTQESESTTVKGTMSYLPPKLLDEGARRPDHFAGDVWCVGETAYELLTATTAFPTPTARMRYASDRILFPSTELNKRNISPEALEFVTSTMAPSPSDRPSPLEALDYAWFPQRDDDDDSPHLSEASIDTPYALHPQPDVLGTDEWTTKEIFLEFAAAAQEPQPLMSSHPAEAMGSNTCRPPEISCRLETRPNHDAIQLSRNKTGPFQGAITHPQDRASSLSLQQDTVGTSLISDFGGIAIDSESPKHRPTPSRYADMAPYQARCSSDEDEELATRRSERQRLDGPSFYTSTASEIDNPAEPRSPSTAPRRSRSSRRTASPLRDGRDTNIGSPYKEMVAPQQQLHDNSSPDHARLSEDRQTSSLVDIQTSYEPPVARDDGHVPSWRASEEGSQGDDDPHHSSPVDGFHTSQTLRGQPGPKLSDIAISLKPKHVEHDDWLNMVALAEYRCPDYMGTNSLPDLHMLERASFTDLGFSTDDPHCVGFLEMLKTPAFRPLWPVDRGKGIFRESCLLLLLSLIQRWLIIARPSSEAPVLPYLPTYELGRGCAGESDFCCERSCKEHWTTSKLYVCRSCEITFCAARREEWKHACTRAGAFDKSRLLERPADPNPPLPDHERDWLAREAKSHRAVVPTDWCPAGLKLVTLQLVSDGTRRMYQRSSIYRVVGEKGKLQLGRYPHSQDTDLGSPHVNLESKYVSRNHAEIELDSGGRWWLRDVGSSYGTYLNRGRLMRRNGAKAWPLKDGDIIQLGGDGHDGAFWGNSKDAARIMFRVCGTQESCGNSVCYSEQDESGSDSSSGAKAQLRAFNNRLRTL